MLKIIVKQSALMAAVCMISVSAFAIADNIGKFNIPAGTLADALKALARQADIEVVYQPEQLKDLRTSGLHGTYSTQQAVSLLLEGTPLQVHTDATGAMVVALPTPQAIAIPSGESASPSSEGSEISPRDRLQLAQTDQGASSSSGPITAGAAGLGGNAQDQVALEEVLVTAQKKIERLQDVPIPVTVISGQELGESNQLSLQNYYSQVPGLNIAPSFYHAAYLSIRGISTGTASNFSNPTVGITVDDVAYGGSWGYGLSSQLPDIDPADLARIEVLRGPQGTLYGASSMGGLLKYVTVDPSTDAVNGRLEAGVDGVYNGAELGYSGRGSVNVPLSDTLAIRGSAYTRRDPGYIDNPVRHIDGVNETRTSGGRLSALWRPADTVSLKLNAVYQNQKSDGESVVSVPTASSYYLSVLTPAQQSYVTATQSGLHGLQQNYAIGTGRSERQVQAYSATFNAKLASIDLAVLSGYNVNAFSDNYDPSLFFNTYTQPGFGTPDSLGYNIGTARKFSQEIRASGSVGQNVDWLLGGFYTHEHSIFRDPFSAVDSNTGAPISLYYFGQYAGNFTEYAGFADVTVHLFDRLDVQIGGRESQIKETYAGFYGGALVGNVITPAAPYPEAKAGAFTYLFTPQFKVSSNAMIYARLASGYRAGGPNQQPVLTYQGQVPSSYGPDKTYNYELGTKDDFLNSALSVDASLYYIDWKNIQVYGNNGLGGTYIANAGQAKSEGLELTLEIRPVSGLSLAGWITLGKAELTADLPAGGGTYGVSGHRLPNTPRVSGNFSVDENFALAPGVTAFVGGVVSYMGNRKWDFTTTSYRQVLPAYTKVDLRAGVKYGFWAVNAYANNIADKRGIVAGAENEFYPYDLTYIQPRTVGLNVVRTF